MWRVGGEPRKKTAGPTLRGAAMRRTLQEGPKVCCGLAVSPGKPRPPTHPARGDFLSCHGSGRFGDTILWSTRGGVGTLRRYHPGLVCAPFFIALFFPQLSSAGGGVVRVQTWMFVVYLAHIKCVSHRRVITQRAATHEIWMFRMPMQVKAAGWRWWLTDCHCSAMTDGVGPSGIQEGQGVLSRHGECDGVGCSGARLQKLWLHPFWRCKDALALMVLLRGMRWKGLPLCRPCRAGKCSARVSRTVFYSFRAPKQTDHV